MNSTDYSTLPDRIKKIYDECTSEEQSVLLQILQEIVDTGLSPTYENIWLQDYKEIPVDKYTFLTDSEFLGETNNNGTAIYPAWMNTMLELESTKNQYFEIALTGATRTGKTTTAVSDALYHLYRLMCLKNPQSYYGLKSITNISFFFFNITQTLAKSVAFREFNTSIANSKWFMEHGKMSKSEANPTYIPEGGLISIEYGSDASHALGRATFCVTGDTRILTEDGYECIDSISHTCKIAQYDHEGGVYYGYSRIQQTGYASELIQIELEDGSVITGTPEHKVLLSNGTYKCLSELTNSDDLITFDYDEVDHMNFKNTDPRFVVYIHTSPLGKRYVGITSRDTVERWGLSGNGYKENKHFYSAIIKYGWDNFTHDIVAENLSLTEASDLESYLIHKFDTMNPDHGYNHTTGGNWSKPSEEVRVKLRQMMKEKWKDKDYRRAVIEGNRLSQSGKHLSEETRDKISKRLKGRPGPNKGKKLPPCQVAKLRGKIPWNKGHTKDDNSSLKHTSEKLLNRKFSEDTLRNMSQTRLLKYEQGYQPIWINNGVVETTIDSSVQSVPDGFVVGRLKRSKTYMYNENKIKYIDDEDIEKYLSLGWKIGRGDELKSKLSSMRKVYKYHIDGKEFLDAESVVQYLRCNGYPNIVASTVTNLLKNGFSSSKRYKELAGRLTYERICE